MTSAEKLRAIPGPARYLIAVIVLLAVGLVTGIGAGFLSGRTGPGAIAGTAGLISVMMAVALGGSIWWWARLDEAAREAHKWAWWWGGTAGMAVGAVLLMTVMFHARTAVITSWAGETPAEILGSGMMAILLFQVAGYAIAWAAWWLQRR